MKRCGKLATEEIQKIVETVERGAPNTDTEVARAFDVDVSCVKRLGYITTTQMAQWHRGAHERLLRQGATKSEAAARAFGVCRSSVKRYAKLAEEGRPLAPKRRPGSKPKMDNCPEAVGGGHGKTPGGHPLRAALVPGEGGGRSGERLDRELDVKAHGMELKKRSLEVGERDELRSAGRLLFARGGDAERSAFVDKMGANVSLLLLYAWSRCGLRLTRRRQGTGARTLPCWRASRARGWGPARRSRDRRRGKSSKPNSSES